MALKQIMLQRKITLKTEQLEELRKKDTEFETREEELITAIGEATTEEEQEAITDEIDAFTKTKEPHEAAKVELEEAIKSLEEELEVLNAKQPKNNDNNEENEGVERSMPKTSKRQQYTTENYYERSDVKEFYADLRARLEARANGAVLPVSEDSNPAELIIPEIIVNRIRERIGDYTTLYPLVDLVIAKGRVKLVLDVDTGEATWLEMRGALTENDDSDLTAVEFDGWKIGRIVYLDNSLLEDSVINLDDYLTKRLARSIAKGLDKAIVVGTGATGKQPEGILPAIPSTNKVTKKATYAELIPALGLIDTGDDATGEIIAVMHRQTYYNHIAALTLHVNSSGADVVQLPNLSAPNFLGLKVVFNNYVGQNKVLFGVFDKYTLVERQAVRIDMSGHYKFREDQTAVRGVGRYDGKPVLPAAFVEVTIDTTEVEEG